MAGPSYSSGFDFSQYPTDQSGRGFDPSQASANTGINGGGGVVASGARDANGNPLPGAGQNQIIPPPPTAGQMGGNNMPPSAGGSQDPQAYFNQLFPGDTLTPDMLTQNEAALKAQGIELVRNAAGVPGKIKLPNGQVIDVIQGAGSGLNKKQWLTGDGGGGAAGGGLNQFGQMSGFMTAPIGQFTPPSAADAMASPGSQYAIDEAMRTMQNSAAAKGTLLNGRTLQAENNAILNQAAGQYGDVFNRALQTYGTNYQTQTGNQDRPFNKYLSLSDLGQRAAVSS